MHEITLLLFVVGSTNFWCFNFFVSFAFAVAVCHWLQLLLLLLLLPPFPLAVFLFSPFTTSSYSLAFLIFNVQSVVVAAAASVVVALRWLAAFFQPAKRRLWGRRVGRNVSWRIHAIYAVRTAFKAEKNKFCKKRGWQPSQFIKSNVSNCN